MSYALEGPKWGSGPRGTTATITWSFADLDLTAALRQSFSGYPAVAGAISPDLRNVVRSAFSLWAAVTGLTFIESADAASNNIRIGQGVIDGTGSIIGEASCWSTGATFVKAAISLDSDAFTSPQTFYSVALHEIGHSIGLDHSTSPTDAMYPYLSVQNAGGLSIDDMAGARVLYATGITLQGTAINDLLTGGSGDDLIYGKEGADTVNAGNGNNIVVGGQDSNDGSDVITAGTGNDLIYGNGGNDNISSSGGNDIAVGGFGADIVSLGAGNDIVYGNQSNDVIDVGDGSNLAFGGQGDDMIRAGAGIDVIWGNEGNDLLTGGGGADRFVFDRASGADRITDFSFAQGDRLQLLGQTFSVTTTGNGDALLALSGGGTILLDGVAAGSFTASAVV